MEAAELLKISEIAERADVPVATVRHYLREGLLPEPVKTSRNMAYYPPEFADRIRLIKQLQEERFLPLKVIRELLDSGNGDPATLRDLVELEDRILERASAGERDRVAVEEIEGRYEVPHDVLVRLEELGVLTPTDEGYSPSDIQIVEAMSRFRAGGYDESIGFTVYDTLRYKKAMEALAAEEVRLLTERLTGMEPDDVIALVEAGTEPLNHLLSALRTKALVAELERLRESRRAG